MEQPCSVQPLPFGEDKSRRRWFPKWRPGTSSCSWDRPESLPSAREHPGIWVTSFFSLRISGTISKAGNSLVSECSTTGIPEMKYLAIHKYKNGPHISVSSHCAEMKPRYHRYERCHIALVTSFREKVWSSRPHTCLLSCNWDSAVNHNFIPFFLQH